MSVGEISRSSKSPSCVVRSTTCMEDKPSSTTGASSSMSTSLPMMSHIISPICVINFSLRPEAGMRARVCTNSGRELRSMTGAALGAGASNSLVATSAQSACGSPRRYLRYCFQSAGSTAACGSSALRRPFSVAMPPRRGTKPQPCEVQAR